MVIMKGNTWPGHTHGLLGWALGRLVITTVAIVVVVVIVFEDIARSTVREAVSPLPAQVHNGNNKHIGNVFRFD